MFKAGDLVKMLNVNMEGNLGIIIKQGKIRADGEQMAITRDEWLVHLPDGREVWFWTNEIRNV
jgi:hypothetical protein